MMQVKINGVVNEVPDGSSIQDILADRNLQSDAVVIELNGEIIKRENWAHLKLSHDDRLELIRLIGGG